MRTLLLFAILCVLSTQRVKSAIDSKSQISVNQAKRESTLKELREMLKQASNSSSNSTGEVTVTRQGPCQCGGGLCGCCSKILFDSWNQKACVNVTYDPDEFSFTAKILMNDRVLYTRTVSGKNPRPVCVPVPRIRIIKACARFYDIYFQGRNIHMCLNMEGKFQDTTVFKVGLDCIRFGANGLAVVKPEDGGGLGQIEFLPGDDEEEDEDNDEDEDDYDYDDDDDDDDDLLDF
nr:PREDICTED: uncharacterized protein LOC100880144 [Megachile rotundata]